MAELMSSKELLAKQVERWASSRDEGVRASKVDIGVIQKELAKLKKQEDLYAKAYAEGMFALGKLQEYLAPLRVKIAFLAEQIADARLTRKEACEAAVPEAHKIEAFAENTAHALHDLKFEGRRAIVLNVIEKVVATREKLEVHGIVRVGEDIELCTKDRPASASQAIALYLILIYLRERRNPMV